MRDYLRPLDRFSHFGSLCPLPLLLIDLINAHQGPQTSVPVVFIGARDAGQARFHCVFEVARVFLERAHLSEAGSYRQRTRLSRTVFGKPQKLHVRMVRHGGNHCSNACVAKSILVLKEWREEG